MFFFCFGFSCFASRLFLSYSLFHSSSFVWSPCAHNFYFHWKYNNIECDQPTSHMERRAHCTTALYVENGQSQTHCTPNTLLLVYVVYELPIIYARNGTIFTSYKNIYKYIYIVYLGILFCSCSHRIQNHSFSSRWAFKRYGFHFKFDLSLTVSIAYIGNNKGFLRVISPFVFGNRIKCFLFWFFFSSNIWKNSVFGVC